MKNKRRSTKRKAIISDDKYNVLFAKMRAAIKKYATKEATKFVKKYGHAYRREYGLKAAVDDVLNQIHIGNSDPEKGRYISPEL